MKLRTKKNKSESSVPKPAVVAVPGDSFFTRRLEIPPEMGPDETAGFVALQLEELSPFSVDQLYYGHIRSRDGASVFLFAAYRRRFTPEQVEGWPQAMSVVPDFAPVLQSSFERETVVLVQSATGLSALLFEANKELPVRVISRPLDPGASPEAFDLLRRTLVERLGARTAQQILWLTGETPQPRAKGLEFFLRAGNSEGGAEVFIASEDCWAMDVRDPAYVALRRKQLGVDVVLWRIVVGAAAAIALLLVGEVLLVGGGAYGAWLENRVENRAPLVAQLQQKKSIAARLNDFGLSGARPFDMLAVVTVIMPDQVSLNQVTFSENNVLAIKGIADDISSMNAFAEAMRGAPDIAEVQEHPYTAVERGTSFDFTVTFRPAAFGGAQADPVAAVSGGGS